LFDAFTHFQALEADYFGAGGLQGLLDGLVGIQDVRLAVEGDFVDDLVDLAADDLLEDLGRLGAVLLGHLGQFDLLFLLDELGRHVGRLVVRRVHGGDVHRQAAGQLLVAALDLDQHADAAAVDVGRHVVAGVHAGDAADLDVLADLGDQGGAGLLDGLAGGQLGVLERFDVGAFNGEGSLGDGGGELDEVVVLGHEVGFGVHFHQHGLAAGLGGGHAAFGGDAAGLLVGLGQAGLAQRLGGGVDVAVGFGERLLALHHAGAGALAQLLDHGCGDFSHLLDLGYGEGGPGPAVGSDTQPAGGG